jgi:SAM-dependent methyltransferase
MSLLQTLSNDAPQFDHSRLSNRRLSDIADVFEALLPHIIRRRKRSVLLHLPSCDVQPVDIPLPEEIEQQMQETHKWSKSRATEQLNELRKLATEAKLAYLHQQAESARKLLILTYLTDDVSDKIAQYLEEFLPNQVAHINGQTPKDERQKQLDSFRHSDGVRVLVGTIRTIGTGLTLFDPSADDTANQIIIADLPYTWAEFEQGIARLHREGQKHRVCVSVLQTKMLATRGDGSAYHTIDEQIWALIQGKRELSDVAVDGKYDTNGASAKVQKALHRWLKQTREMGVEPLAVERRSDEQSEAQKWRRQIAHLRAISTAKADELFAEPEYTRQFLAHLKNSPILQLSHQWLRGKLSLLLRPDLTVIDMGCGLNPFADLPCRLIGLDRHHQPEQPSSQYVRGKMENPPLPDKSADVLIYSLSLFGTPSDLMAYFTQAVRILRGGGHLFIVELDSTFTPEGLARFIKGLSKFGFELVGSVKDLWSQDGAKLKGMHFTLTGEMGQPEETDFERK